jgi:multimeric flavodoxin WrbA
MIKEKILKTDIILVSFPLFYFGMPGEVKCLLDRLLSIMNTYSGQLVPEDPKAPLHGFRYDMAGKKLIVISGCAWNDDKVFNPLLGQLDCICGNDGYTALFCPQIKAVVDRGGNRLERYLKRYEDAGAEFAASGCLSAETKEQLKKTPFSAAVYEQILTAYWAQEREAGGLNK